MIFNRFSFGFWPLVVTLTAFVILCKLGLWQLERAEQKRQLLTKYQTRSILNADSFDALASKSLEALDGREVNVSLIRDDETIWLVDNKIHQGQVGYSVVVPATIEGTRQRVLVDLGWWSAPTSRADLPSISLPTRLPTQGVIKSTQFEAFLLGESKPTSQWPKRIQSLKAAIDFDYTEPVLPVVIFAESDTVPGHPQLYKPVVMPPEKHEAYALQWFLLALFSIGVFAAASYKRNPVKTNNKKEGK